MPMNVLVLEIWNLRNVSYNNNLKTARCGTLTKISFLVCLLELIILSLNGFMKFTVLI